MSIDTAVEIDGQYRAMKEGAGVLDRSSRAKFVVRGSDGAEFLQGQLTNDIEALEPDAGCYSALLDRKGHMQADMRVLRLNTGDLWLDTEPEVAGTVERHLRMYSVGREVEIEDASGDWSIVSVVGPGAVEAAGSPPVAPEHSQRHYEREGVEILAVATDLGLDLIVRAEQSVELQELLARSEAVGVSEAAAEILRVEAGRPRFGREMTTATIPQEADIDGRAVSFTKGCYIGQETVARLHYKGKPNRHLRGLRLEAPADAGDAIRLGEREVGSVGTTVLSPAHGQIALAVIRREAEPGARVEIGDQGVGAEVVPLPF
ncbi:MAG TPA: glycine cleavage T C-terminal barrel domain-containing protein [Solirubrobacterales bacterium]|nr:glycine cleavage T C-terminal barrel domain-containing protein [Solirubrobacterales bacterium]